MIKLLYLLQITAGLGILNVWFLRANVATAYRGSSAKNLKEEFAAYGLPDWFRILIGALKTVCALLLVAGLWFSNLVCYAALLLASLMIGAIAMHIKVKDPFTKSIPAIVMLAMCIAIVYLSTITV